MPFACLPQASTNSMQNIIARNLAQYRKSVNLSAERLAGQVGVARQTIHNYEAGKTLPNSRTLAALARSLGVTVDDLLREGPGVPCFRFRAHISFSQRPQFAAHVTRMLDDYVSL